MLLHESRVGRGGVDLLIFVNQPRTHHEHGGDGGEGQRANGGRDHDLDEREGSAGARGKTDWMAQRHGAARSTVIDCE